MIKTKVILLISSLILLYSVGNAQTEQADETLGVQKFSLLEAQTFAIENNATMKNKQIDIAIAKQKVWETTAIGLPQFSVKGTFQYQFSVPTLKMGTLVPIPVESTPDQYDHTHEMMFSELQLGSQQSFNIDFTVSQLVFSGEYLVGLQASRVFMSLSEKALEKSVIETKEQIAQTYYLALVLSRNAEILDSSFQNMQKITTDMEKMFKQGFVEETDYSQISLTSLNVKNGLISINRQKEVILNLLKMQMGLDYESKIELTDKLESFLNDAEFAALALTEFSIDNNIDYQLINVQERASYLMMQREKSKYLPSIAAFYRHQEQINAPEFNFSPPDIIGLSIEIPVFSSGMRNARLKQAKMELQKIENTKIQVHDALTIEFERAKNDFLAAQDKYNNQKENYKLSKSIYDKTLIKYNTGTSSSLDLTQVQNQFFSAQSNYFQAIVELLNAKAKLDRLLNSTTQN